MPTSSSILGALVTGPSTSASWSGGTSVERSQEYGSFFAEASGGEGERCKYPTRLDTYGCGCAHNCNYCYARSLLDFRKKWNPSNPSVASTADISKALRKVKAGTVLRLGGMTDCFQPLERVYGATRQAIQMMNARGIGYLIVTKSVLVADKSYLRILDPELAHIQISVTSTSDEPNFLGERASKPSDRLRAAEKLSKAGYDVSLRVSPYIPELVDIEALKRSNVRKCLVEFLRVNGFISGWLANAGRATSEYTHKAGGYRHLPLWKKQALLEPFRDFELTVCEDVPEHYDYWRLHVNANQEDCCNLRR